MTHRATTRLRRRERILRAKGTPDSTLPRLSSRIARFGGSVAPTSRAATTPPKQNRAPARDERNRGA